MLDNTITVPFDAVAALAVTTPSYQTYNRFSESLNRTDYHRDDHTVSLRKTLQVYRTPGKRNGESLGIQKSAIKLTWDVAVPNASGTGNITLPFIAEVSFANPVGVSAANSLNFRRRLLSLLNTEALITKLVDSLEI